MTEENRRFEYAEALYEFLENDDRRKNEKDELPEKMNEVQKAMLIDRGKKSKKEDDKGSDDGSLYFSRGLRERIKAIYEKEDK